MHGVESRSALKRKRIVTPAEVKAYYPPRIVETQSADIRDLFRQQVPGRDEEETAASTSKGKGKRKGKGKAARDGGKGKGKARGEAGGKEVLGSPHEGQSGLTGTREMGRHSGTFLDGFHEFLVSRAGGKKSVRNAKGIVANASKYLYWCDPSEPEPAFLYKAKRYGNT